MKAFYDQVFLLGETCIRNIWMNNPETIDFNNCFKKSDKLKYFYDIKCEKTNDRHPIDKYLSLAYV